MSEDNKELITELKKLRNSIEKLTILFEFVKKELVEDYDKKDNSEALLKKLLNQNQVIAQGMVKLSDSVTDYTQQQSKTPNNSLNNQPKNNASPSNPQKPFQDNTMNPASNTLPPNQPNPFQNNTMNPANNTPPPNNTTNPNTVNQQPTNNPNQAQPPKMDFTNFKSLNDTKQPNNVPPPPNPTNTEPKKEEKKGFLGMFKK
ncbi:MAG: hypothetical protein ACMXX9_02915 [Candidatus Woesearchaeota archaeon]